MAKLDDLTGRTYGHLKVIEPAPDHITPSGQKRKFWLCECQLCGRRKAVSAQDLKRGTVTSCGCYRAAKGKQSRNVKTCAICGKEFECPPSSKKITCSKECQIEYARRRRTGYKLPQETKDKISEKARGRDMSIVGPLGVAAAMASPKSGKFETNVNAIDWHLISPEGKHYYFHSLNHWMRENGERFFGCKQDTKEFKNATSGLSGAKRAAKGGNYGSCTYKGWRVIPNEDQS